MKIAVAGKGGVGKTAIAAWFGDHLAREGRNVFLIDADTALSLGRASGLSPALLPRPLIEREDLVTERVGAGLMALCPEVGDLPERLAVELPLGGQLAIFPGPADPDQAGAGRVGLGRKRLLVMGGTASAGGGCACAANALLKALLAHLVLDRHEWVIVDLEAGVEHLGRGTVAGVDGLVVVSEPSLRGLETAASIARMARELGLARQALVLNRADAGVHPPVLPELADLPPLAASLPCLDSLAQRQLVDGSVLGLPEAGGAIAQACRRILDALRSSSAIQMKDAWRPEVRDRR
ncbi:ATP-binding protein [Desulfolutivibrio sp.]|uniref:ATP-binding protein n=1 Tax=Desulfolutivibrio sp. TaxID=2773296 RepID=UPI002F963A6C